MKTPLTLRELFESWVTVPLKLDTMPRMLSLDTQTLEQDGVFFALKGGEHNGENYIDEALAKGASAIVLDTPDNHHIKEIAGPTGPIPQIFIHQLHQHLGAIAGRFYHYPQRDLNLIGVTGTSGKTSCAHFIANALHSQTHPCGVIGTLGYGLCSHLKPLAHTTPPIFKLYHLLDKLRAKGAKTVVMEVSSHALKQERIQGLAFKIGIFTNLSQDHLDYHGTLVEYADCKRLFFTHYPMENAVLNYDDPQGKTWLDNPLSNTLKFAYTTQEKLPNASCSFISAQHFSSDMGGFKASIKSPWGDGVLHSHLLGRANLYNLLATLSVLGIYQIPLSEALHRLTQLHAVPGRMEKIGGGNQPLVIVDYSHKPDALQKALETLRPYCKGELWCVVGCGGNRDTGKRPMMGAIAERLADNVILTDDNPRHEDPKAIVQAIVSGLKNPDKAIIEHDRQRAILHAVSCAQPEDIILIAGKGHEKTQQIGNKINPFSDIIEAKLALENRIEKL